MSVKVGEKAPLFKLYASDKSEVALEDYRGRNVVLLFFPMAFSSICTAELCAMRDDISNYTDLNAQVFAISVDAIGALDRFRQEQGLNFPLLSDFNKDISRSYGALYEEWILGMKGVSKRSAFVINGDGIVKYAEVLESAGDLPDFDAVKKALV